MKESNRKKIGYVAEQKICQLLESYGLKLVQQNFSCRLGEIDLIMLDGQHYVFIEVRTRTNTLYGSPIESVNYAKQRKIIKAATYYLHKNKKFDKVHCRFDVIGIHNNKIEWIKNAFY